MHSAWCCRTAEVRWMLSTGGQARLCKVVALTSRKKRACCSALWPTTIFTATS